MALFSVNNFIVKNNILGIDPITSTCSGPLTLTVLELATAINGTITRNYFGCTSGSMVTTMNVNHIKIQQNRFGVSPLDDTQMLLSPFPVSNKRSVH